MQGRPAEKPQVVGNVPGMRRWVIVAVEIVALVAAAVILFLLLRGDGSDSTATQPTQASSTTTTVAPTSTDAPTTTTAGATTSTSTSTTAAPTTTVAPTTTILPVGTVVEVVWADGAVVAISLDGQPFDDDRVPVPVGDDLRLTVAADLSDEVHVHGYDLFSDVTPTQPAEFEFVADAAGIFEVEFERSHSLIIELVIS